MLTQVREENKLTSIKRLSKLLILLFVSMTITAALSLVAQAEDDNLPSLMNVEIVGDYLYWDSLGDTKVYSYSVKNGGGYFDALTDENGNVLKRQCLNLKEHCEKFEVPSGTFSVQLVACSGYLWKQGEYISEFWRGSYTYVTDKTQLDKPTNVQLDGFELSWNPVPNATKYTITFHRLKEDNIRSEISFHYETTDTHFKLKEGFIPNKTHYSVYLVAHADGYFDSEEYAKTYVYEEAWLKENLPDAYIKNVAISADGIISWDPYPEASAYMIDINGCNAMVAPGKEVDVDSATGRLSCDINGYCVSFGCTPSELDVSISAYTDYTWEGGYRISGITSLKYNYLGSEPLTGEIVYSGYARYADVLYARLTGAPSGIELNYEWQVHKNGEWQKIESAANKAYLEIKLAELIGKYVRVVITAKSSRYVGTVVGAPKEIGKSAPYKPVPELQLSFTLTKVNDKDTARINVLNYQSDIEYVITDTPAAGAWPSNATQMKNGSYDVLQTNSAKTYYIYARYAETATRECGTYYVGGSVVIPEKNGSNVYAKDMIYPAFDTKTPTVYMKVGDVITIKYQLNPIGATENLPVWKSNYSGIVNVNNNATKTTLTITASATGMAFVTAYKQDNATPWSYGNDYSSAGRSIKVVVYDPNNLNTVPFDIIRLDDVDMYIGDSYTIDLNELSKLPFVPEGVDKSKYKYSAYVVTKDNLQGMPFVGETSKDGSVVIKNAVITAKKSGKATVYVFAKTDNSVPATASQYFAYFNVNVSVKPVITVEKLTLNNKSLSLRVGETIKLLATKDPAAAPDAVTWSSNNKSVVSVDGNGKLTAEGVGKATITAKCGGKSATCTVEVLPAYCAAHEVIEYSYVNEKVHMWTCVACGATGAETHYGRTWSSDGTHHWKTCDTFGCGAIIDSTKATHTASGANAATCQNKAVCNICKKNFGALAAHAPSSKLTYDKTGHWNACNTADCTEKLNFASHTPDHEGSATEDYAIKCKTCGYIIEEQLAHTHDFDKQIVDEKYRASVATCTARATYYKSCRCGAKGTKTFEDGELAKHTESTEWEKDAAGHWHICTAPDCGIMLEAEKTAHELSWVIDRAATETESGLKHEECKICGYKLDAVEIPATGTDDKNPPANQTASPKPSDNIGAPQGNDDNGLAGWLIPVIAIVVVAAVGVIVIMIRKKKTIK